MDKKAFFAALAAAMVVSSSFGLTDVYWINGSGGDWNNAANWSGGAVPNSADCHVHVTNQTAVTIALGSSGATAYNYGTCVYTNGLVDIVSGGTFNVDGGTTGATNVDFRVNSALGITGTLNVRDYTALYPYRYGSGSGAMNVYGTFTPADANYFYGCTMQNGSTIDLSAKTVAWNSTAKSDANYKRTVEFAPGATVTVNLAGRTLVRGDKII